MRRLNIVEFVIFILLTGNLAWAQCPSATFAVPATACREQTLDINYTPGGDVVESWDFCAGSFLNAPSSIPTASVSGLQSGFDIRGVREGSMHYVFIASSGSGQVIRLTYNGSMSVTPVAEVVASVSEPQGIGLWQEGDQKFALVVTKGGAIHRLSFGASYGLLPNKTSLTGLSGLTDLRHIKVFKQDGHVVATVVVSAAGLGDSRIMILDFGASILSEPIETSVSVPSSSFLLGIDVVVECTNVYVVTTGFSTNSIHVLDFGTSIFNTPTFQMYTDVTSPLGLSIVETGGDYYAFVATNTDGIDRIKFGNSMENSPTDKTVLGNFGMPSNLQIAFEMYQADAKYYGLAVNYSGNNLLVLDFPKDCDATESYSNQTKPVVSYATAGTYNVELKVADASGNVVRETHQIVIGSSTAPDIDFTSSPACAGLNASFQSVNTSGDINTYAWEFGDGGTSTIDNPSHTYGSGQTFPVTLSVISTNGCPNAVTKAIVVRSTVADFDLPIDPTLCTNQELTFTSKVDSYPAESVEYVWQVDGTELSTTNALTLSPGQINNYDVRLQVKNGTCVDELTQTLVISGEGPNVNFEVVGKCQGETITFTNTTTGDVLSYLWSFGSEGTSTFAEPTYTFTGYGVMDISLLVEGVSGCQSELVKQVQIGAKPAAEFSVAPTLLCSTNVASFTESSTVPSGYSIASWNWSFGNGNDVSVVQNPEYTYQAGGSYTVSLLIESDFGCTDTKQTIIEVKASPTSAFELSSQAGYAPLEIVATNTSVGSVASDWSLDAAGNSTEINPTFTFDTPGIYEVSLTVTSDTGCTDTSTLEVKVSTPDCPIAFFNTNAQACRNQLLTVGELSQGAATYRWDFCSGSLSNVPAVLNTLDLPAFANVFDVQTVMEEESRLIFALSVGSNSIARLNFGASFSGSAVISDLGNLGSIGAPQGLALWQQGVDRYGLLATSTGRIFRLNFAGSFLNQPTLTELEMPGGLSDLRHVEITNSGGTLYAAIAGGATGKVVLLSFGASLANAPTVRTIPVPSSSFLTGIDLYHTCETNAIVMSGFQSGIHILDFGSGFDNDPTFVLLTDIQNPLGLSVEDRDGQIQILASSQTEGLVRLDFGSSLSNTPSKTTVGNVGVMDFAIGFEITRIASKYYGVGINYATNKLFVLDFPKDCEWTESFDNVPAPSVSYSNAGTYTISLQAVDQNGTTNSYYFPVTVADRVAPDIDFNQLTHCAGTPVAFEAVNNSGDISTYTWSFGNGDVANTSSPQITYLQGGEYKVQLAVASSNTCVNSTSKNVVITEVNAAFELPSASPLCANQIFGFQNSGSGFPAETFNEEWSVNGEVISTEAAMEYNFTSVGTYSILLKVENNGCQQELVKELVIDQKGAVVDFSFEGQCQNSAIQFTPLITGDFESLNWTFGTDDSTQESNPQRIFGSSGLVTTKLVATSANGCLNSRQKDIMIFSQPQPSFTLDLPPFSCAGSPSQFHDTTPIPGDANITSWTWSFGDGENGSSKNPTHTYNSAGNYSVQLTTTTDTGCSNSITTTITIADSPSPTLTMDVPCANQAVGFRISNEIPIKQWLWKIDNSTYSIQNPTHVFVNSGNYQVKLEMLAENGCPAKVERTVNVPLVPELDFSIENACALNATKFANDSASPSDPVVTTNWTINNETSLNGAIVEYAFASKGSFPVTMEVQTNSGCTYSLSRIIPIYESPIADFTTSVESGPPPLEVSFENTSTGAVGYTWKINDVITSSQSSLTQSFLELGDFVVDLIAQSENGCTASKSQVINVIIPRTELALEEFNLILDEGTGTRLNQLVVKNNSNYKITQFDVQVELGNGTIIQERVSKAILPGAESTFILANSLVGIPSGYVCAEIRVVNDENANNNRRCNPLEDASILFTPSPNPAHDKVRLEVIAPGTSVAQIKMVNSFGAAVFETEVEVAKGLNLIDLDLGTLQPGIYFLRLEAGGQMTTHRIVLQ